MLEAGPADEQTAEQVGVDRGQVVLAGGGDELAVEQREAHARLAVLEHQAVNRDSLRIITIQQRANRLVRTERLDEVVVRDVCDLDRCCFELHGRSLHRVVRLDRIEHAIVFFRRNGDDLRSHQTVRRFLNFIVFPNT